MPNYKSLSLISGNQMNASMIEHSSKARRKSGFHKSGKAIGLSVVQVETMPYVYPSIGQPDSLIQDIGLRSIEPLPGNVKLLPEQHRALHGKREAEVMYHYLVEHIPEIIYHASLDQGGRILYVSPQIERLGFTPEAWMQDMELRFRQMHEEDRECVRTAFEHSCRTGEVLRCDYRLIGNNGKVYWFHDEARLVRDHSDTPLFLQGVMLDITSQKAMEEELEVYRRHLEQCVALRTMQMERHIACLEACNAALCEKLQQFSGAHGGI